MRVILSFTVSLNVAQPYYVWLILISQRLEHYLDFFRQKSQPVVKSLGSFGARNFAKSGRVHVGLADHLLEAVKIRVVVGCPYKGCHIDDSVVAFEVLFIKDGVREGVVGMVGGRLTYDDIEELKILCRAPDDFVALEVVSKPRGIGGGLLQSTYFSKPFEDCVLNN